MIYRGNLKAIIEFAVKTVVIFALPISLFALFEPSAIVPKARTFTWGLTYQFNEYTGYYQNDTEFHSYIYELETNSSFHHKRHTPSLYFAYNLFNRAEFSFEVPFDFYREIYEIPYVVSYTNRRGGIEEIRFKAKATVFDWYVSLAFGAEITIPTDAVLYREGFMVRYVDGAPIKHTTEDNEYRPPSEDFRIRDDLFNVSGGIHLSVIPKVIPLNLHIMYYLQTKESHRDRFIGVAAVEWITSRYAVFTGGYRDSRNIDFSRNLGFYNEAFISFDIHVLDGLNIKTELSRTLSGIFVEAQRTFSISCYYTYETKKAKERRENREKIIRIKEEEKRQTRREKKFKKREEEYKESKNEKKEKEQTKKESEETDIYSGEIGDSWDDDEASIEWQGK